MSYLFREKAGGGFEQAENLSGTINRSVEHKPSSATHNHLATYKAMYVQVCRVLRRRGLPPPICDALPNLAHVD